MSEITHPTIKGKLQIDLLFFLLILHIRAPPECFHRIALLLCPLHAANIIILQWISLSQFEFVLYRSSQPQLKHSSDILPEMVLYAPNAQPGS